MRLFTAKIFAGVVAGDTNGVFATYTLPQYQAMLGSAETLAFEATVSDIVGSPTTFQLDTQWSNSGNLWTTRATKVIQLTPSAATYLGVEASTVRGGALVRVALYLKGAATTANVQVVACGRAEQSWL